MEKSPFYPPVFTSVASIYSPLYGSVAFATASVPVATKTNDEQTLNDIEKKKIDIVKNINNFINDENSDLALSLLSDIQIQIQRYKIKSDRKRLNLLIQEDSEHKNISGIYIDPMPKLKKIKIKY